MQTTTLEAERLNILAVDDEAGSRTALGVVLKLAGHRAVFAKDGDEALEVFQKTPTQFDVVITDHQMVRVSGLDLVRGLRERGFAGEIVVLTAYAGQIEEEEYRKLDVVGLMEKPFDISELRDWLACMHGYRDHTATEPDPTIPARAIDFCWMKPETPEDV